MTSVPSILVTQHPRVAAAVAAVPPDRLGETVRALVQMTAEACAVRNECERASNFAALVADLDEVAWDAQATEERGERPTVPYEVAFRRARAADAWMRAATATDAEAASEAVYEALHALGGDAEAENRVITVLTP